MKNSLTKKEIQEILKQKTAFKTPTFLFKSRRGQFEKSRVAFAISRRQGNAVVRNRFRRRIRELLRNEIAGKPQDVVCVAYKPLNAKCESSWPKDKEKIKRWCENI